ncbi:MAG: hypothetical protein PSX80_17070 [bacterium]|nr:hypothetical protein [bacterium]
MLTKAYQFDRLRCGIGSAFLVKIIKVMVLALLLAVAASAQASGVAGTIQEKATTPAPDSPTTAQKIKRWFEMDTLNLSVRYRHMTTNVNLNASDVAQFRFQAKGRFKFDNKGKYSISAGIYTGNSITGGWGSTGWGTGGPQTNLYLKQLYFEAKPVKGLAIQVGGIAPINGENTEITGYDNDAYLMGERISIRDAKKFFFDEISLTNAHIGDVFRPSVFSRFKRLDESNYHQILVKKTLNKNVAVSADYTFEAGRDTFRQGVRFSIPKFKVFDSMRFENYQQVDPNPNYGFAISGDKKLNNRLSVKAGFARIDTTMFNGDWYGRGNRVFAGWNYTLTRELSFNGVWLQGVGPLPAANSIRSRFEVALTFNILETLKRRKVI